MQRQGMAGEENFDSQCIPMPDAMRYDREKGTGEKENEDTVS